MDLEEDIIPEKEKIELEEIPEENKIKSIERETRLQEIRIKYLQLEKKKKKIKLKKINWRKRLFWRTNKNKYNNNNKISIF